MHTEVRRRQFSCEFKPVQPALERSFFALTAFCSIEIYLEYKPLI